MADPTTAGLAIGVAIGVLATFTITCCNGLRFCETRRVLAGPGKKIIRKPLNGKSEEYEMTLEDEPVEEGQKWEWDTHVHETHCCGTFEVYA
jgi:hypothetical protein